MSPVNCSKAVSCLSQELPEQWFALLYFYHRISLTLVYSAFLLPLPRGLWIQTCSQISFPRENLLHKWKQSHGDLSLSPRMKLSASLEAPWGFLNPHFGCLPDIPYILMWCWIIWYVQQERKLKWKGFFYLKCKGDQGRALEGASLNELTCQQERKWEWSQANNPNACT